MKSPSHTGWDDRTKMHEFLAMRVIKGQSRVERIKDQATAYNNKVNGLYGLSCP